MGQLDVALKHTGVVVLFKRELTAGSKPRFVEHQMRDAVSAKEHLEWGVSTANP